MVTPKSINVCAPIEPARMLDTTGQKEDRFIISAKRKAERIIMREAKKTRFNLKTTERRSIESCSCKVEFGVCDEVLRVRKDVDLQFLESIECDHNSGLSREKYRQVCRSIYLHSKNKWADLVYLMRKLGFIDIRKGGHDYYIRKIIFKIGNFRIIHNDKNFNLDDSDFDDLARILGPELKPNFKISEYQTLGLKGQAFDENFDPMQVEDDIINIDYPGVVEQEDRIDGTVFHMIYCRQLSGINCQVCQEYIGESWIVCFTSGNTNYQVHCSFCDECCPVQGHRVSLSRMWFDACMSQNQASATSIFQAQARGMESQGWVSYLKDMASNGLSKVAGLPGAMLEHLRNIAKVAALNDRVEKFKTDYGWLLEVLGSIALLGAQIYMYGTQASISLMLVIVYMLKNKLVSLGSLVVDFFSSMCKIFSKDKKAVDINMLFMQGEDEESSYGLIAAITTVLTVISGIVVYKDKFDVSTILQVSKSVVSYGHELVVKGSQFIGKAGELLQKLIERAFCYFGCPLGTTMARLSKDFEEHVSFYNANKSIESFAGAFTQPARMKVLDDEISKLAGNVALAKSLKAIKIESLLTTYLTYFRGVKSSMASTYVRSLPKRPVPVVVQWQGAGGIGKSTLETRFCQTILIKEQKANTKQVCDPNKLADFVYPYRNRSDLKDSYMTAFRDHFIITFPEFGQRDDDFTSPSQDIETIMSAIDSEAWRTPQSESAAKGQVGMENVGYCSITTNVKGPWNVSGKNWKDPMAVHRRLHLNYRVELKTEGVCTHYDKPWRDLTYEERDHLLKTFCKDIDCPVTFMKFRYVPVAAGSAPGGQVINTVTTQDIREVTFKDIVKECMDLRKTYVEQFKAAFDPKAVEDLVTYVSQAIGFEDELDEIDTSELTSVTHDFLYTVGFDKNKAEYYSKKLPVSDCDNLVAALEILINNSVDQLKVTIPRVLYHNKKYYGRLMNAFVDVNSLTEEAAAAAIWESEELMHNYGIFFKRAISKPALATLWFSIVSDRGICLLLNEVPYGLFSEGLIIKSKAVDVDEARFELIRQKNDTSYNWIIKILLPMLATCLTIYGGYYVYKYFTRKENYLEDVEVIIDGEKYSVKNGVKSKFNDIYEKLVDVKRRIASRISSWLDSIWNSVSDLSVVEWAKSIWRKVKSFFSSEASISVDVPYEGQSVQEAVKDFEEDLQDGMPWKTACRKYADAIGDLCYEQLVGQSATSAGVPRVVKHRPVKQTVMKEQSVDFEIDQDAVAIRAKTLKNLASFWGHTKKGTWVRITCGTFVRGRSCILPKHGYKKLCRYDRVKLFRACSEASWCGNLSDETVCLDMKTLEGVNYMDLCLVTWKSDLMMFADITKHFVKESDLACFESVPVTLSTVEEHDIIYSNDVIKTQLIFKEYIGSLATPVENQTYETYFDEDGQRVRQVVIIPKGWSYPYPTAKGDCGGALTANNRSLGRKIIGIHVCGNDHNMGCAATVTQETILYNLSLLDNLKGQSIDPVIEFKYYDNGEVINCNNIVEIDNTESEILSVIDSKYLGSCSVLGESVYNDTKPVNKIIKSPLYDKFSWKSTKEPVYIAKEVEIDGVKHHQMQLLFSKLHASAKDLNMQQLRDCAEDAMSELYAPGWEKFAKIYSIDEVVFGARGTDFISSLNVNASCGKIWEKKRKGGSKGKKQWIDLDSKWLDPEVREACELQMEEWKRGVRQFDVFSAEKKVELRTPPKHLEPRLYNSGDMVTLINTKRLFGGLIEWCGRRWLQTGVTIGINPYKDFRMLGIKLQSKGPKVFAGDFKKFDGSLQQKLLYVVLEQFIEFYRSAGVSEDWIRAMYTCSNVIRLYACVVEGELVLLDKGNPSGNWMTGHINSFCVKTSLRYIWIEIFRVSADPYVNFTLESYNKNVAEAVNGDDNAVNISDLCCERFNQISVAKKYLDVFGMVYTDEAKTGVLNEYTDLKSISYLKRNFTEDEWGVLDKTSIQEIPLWMKRGISTLDNFVSSLKSFLIEASFWGQNYYEFVREQLVRALRGTQFHNVRVWTWDEIENFKINESWHLMPTFIKS